MALACPLLNSLDHALPDGGKMRYTVIEPDGPPAATLLVLPGRREFIEKKFAELGGFFQKKRFRLIFFEWRGHGFSTRALAGPLRQRDHILSFETYLSDLRGFYERVVQPNRAGTFYIFGHSMGGHLGLRWLAETPPRDVKGAIFTAPMLALGPRAAHSVALGVGYFANELGFGDHYAPGQHDYGPSERSFEGNPLTHDPLGFQRMPNYFDAYPDLTVGGVTWSWILAALRSMREARNASYLRQITVPVLSITGDRDRVTPAREIERYLNAIPGIENIVLPGALHDVMDEDERYKGPALEAIERFLASSRGASSS